MRAKRENAATNAARTLAAFGFASFCLLLTAAAAMFAQSEFGFSKRSYHCKHGAAAVAAAAVVVVPLRLIAHSDLSLYSSLFHEKERSFRCTTSLFRSAPCQYSRVLSSFTARRVPRTSGSSSTAVSDGPPQQRCSIQIPIAKRGVSLSLSLSCATLCTPR